MLLQVQRKNGKQQSQTRIETNEGITPAALLFGAIKGPQMVPFATPFWRLTSTSDFYEAMGTIPFVLYDILILHTNQLDFDSNSLCKSWVIKFPIEHHPTIRYMVYNGYYKVMSNIPKMGQLPTPVNFEGFWSQSKEKKSVSEKHPAKSGFNHPHPLSWPEHKWHRGLCAIYAHGSKVGSQELIAKHESSCW